ncbi:hypothetical protein [Belliella aquatica]|uniref:Uncharacterized protein n=1 Tax=Belliella aquatica TaxID=1323734 RepID=A0ABQ1LZK2_9BACT|nr:hypothetical protein [Belliella aquatica]MCH7405723.1 hypothetical protein [Belliella aquatica]GGC31252.1 hypothetical protein GCM10010993_07700 [Belliella aquatica]
MKKINIFICLLLVLFSCYSSEKQNYQNLNQTIKVTIKDISGKFSKVKFLNGKFVALNQFSLEGQSLYIINENGKIWEKQLIKPNSRTIIGGIPEEIFLFQDYFYLIKDIGQFVKYSYLGEEIEKISMRHVFPEKNKCKTIEVDKNGTCYFSCYSLMENNVKEFTVIKGVIGSDNFSEIHKGRVNDNVNELAFFVGNNELYVLMPYSNEIGIIDLNNQNYRIEEFEISENRKYIKPKEFTGSGFEYAKLSKSERAEYKSDKHIQIYVNKDKNYITSQLVSDDIENPFLVQNIERNKKNYFEISTKYPVSFDNQGHFIGYTIEEDYYKFFIKPFIKSLNQ